MTDDLDSRFPMVREGEIGGVLVQTVDGRELHTALDTPTKFRDWARRRVTQLGLEDGVDYVRFENLSRSNLSAAKSRDQHTAEYAFTLHAAKHIAMVEKNDMGKRVRNYFIECERKVQQPSLPNSAMRDLLFDQKITLLNLALRHFGPEGYRRVWDDIGFISMAGLEALPVHENAIKTPDGAALLVPPAPFPHFASAEDAAFSCLRHLLRQKVAGKSIRGLIERGIVGDEAVTGTLKHVGIKVKERWFPGEEGFLVWQRSRVLRGVFGATPWYDHGWNDALAHLPGAVSRLDAGPDSHKAKIRVSVFVPSELLLDPRS